MEPILLNIPNPQTCILWVLFQCNIAIVCWEEELMNTNLFRTHHSIVSERLENAYTWLGWMEDDEMIGSLFWIWKKLSPTLCIYRLDCSHHEIIMRMMTIPYNHHFIVRGFRSFFTWMFFSVCFQNVIFEFFNIYILNIIIITLNIISYRNILCQTLIKSDRRKSCLADGIDQCPLSFISCST